MSWCYKERVILLNIFVNDESLEQVYVFVFVHVHSRQKADQDTGRRTIGQKIN